MLLFIQNRSDCCKESNGVSIHLMLLFISFQQEKSSRNILVSIHLMLLFIECWKSSCSTSWKFQYISCYSLSKITELWKRTSKVFQYISCYSLSIKHEDTSTHLLCFNTSHVTLYHSP